MGAYRVAKTTIAEHGFLGVYKGYSALLMFSMPKNYTRFYGYQFAQTNVFTTKDRKNNFLCGLFAGCCEATLVVTPQETLKTRLVHDKLKETPQYKNTFDGIAKIVKAQGLGGLYKGYLATLAKQSTNQGVRFVVYTDTTKKLQQYCSVKVICDLFAGAFAGFCSTMFNNPVDVIKTKMQGVDAHKYNGFIDCGKQIMATSGPMGFYSGIGPRLVRVCLDVALTFTIYGAIKRQIQKILLSMSRKSEDN
jgi:solute carrier family 25 (mitochondrial citrate transporter), member 1